MISHTTSISKLCSKAAINLFPKVQLVEEFCDEKRFCARFFSSAPFSMDQLERIQDKMSEIKGGEPNFHLMEMVPKSALELFRSVNQNEIVKRLETILDPSVLVVKIGESYDLVKNVFEKDISKLHFKLTHYQQKETAKGFLIDLFGLVGIGANDLKKNLKEFSKLQKYGHIALGEKQKLWTYVDQTLLLQPKGAYYLSSLKKLIFKEFEKMGMQKISLIGPELSKKELSDLLKSYDSPLYYIDKKGKKDSNPLSEGLFGWQEGTQDHWICRLQGKNLAEESISYLKFNLKIFKILGFSWRIELCGPKCQKTQKLFENEFEKVGYKAHSKDSLSVKIHAYDSKGRKVTSSVIEAQIMGSKCVLFGQVCRSYEKLLAYLLEESEGVFPIEWQKEPLRIIALKDGVSFAKEIQKYFRENLLEVGVDTSQEKLSVRLKKAYLEGIPMIAIVGDKEEKQKTLTLMDERLKQEIEGSKEEILEYLLNEMNKRE